MIIIFKHTWVLFIAVTILNALILKYRSKKHILKNPDLREGYQKYFKGIILYGNIPWIIMAFGNLSGSTQNILEYFNPEAMNPFVLLFHAAIVLLWLLSIYWVYIKRGAEFIESHPGLFKAPGYKGSSDVTARQVRSFYPIMLLVGVVVMITMWNAHIPIPEF